MESSLPDKQRTIQTLSHILQTLQFTWNISTNDEQYIQRATS